jgi:hypothetical protein
MEIPDWQEGPPIQGAVTRQQYERYYVNALYSPDRVFDKAGNIPGYSQVERRAPIFRASGAAAPREIGGVDLNLDGFQLSDPKRVACQAAAERRPEQEWCTLGGAFWASLDGGSEATFHDKAKSLLVDVFNPALSDRRAEGDSFVPPETSFSYVQQLCSLVKEEDIARERRRHHFCSKDFVAEDPGPFFPSTWRASFEIARVQQRAGCTGTPGGCLHERPDYLAEAAVFKCLLQSAVPEFDKIAEDSMRFRVYKFGALEVRTTQERGGEEVIGAIFSLHAPKHDEEGFLGGGGGRTAPPAQQREREVIVKATEYVEAPCQSRERTQAPLASRCRAYVVLETEQGTAVVTEMRKEDGAATWEVNPQALDVRNSLAKVFQTTCCRPAGVTLGDLKSYQAKEQSPECDTTTISGKIYAAGVYSKARGTRG